MTLLERITALIARIFGLTGNIPPPDTTAPLVTLTASSATVTLAGKLTLTAVASDNLAVTRVDFYRNATFLGTSGLAPFALSENVSYGENGVYTYRAVAFDAAGNHSESSTLVTVTIPPPPPPDLTPPTVTLIASATTFTEEGTLTLTLEATDNVAVVDLKLYRNNVLIATPPNTGTVTDAINRTLGNGTYQYRLTAKDAAGLQASTTVNVGVNIPPPPPAQGDSTPPAVSLTATPNNLTQNGTVTLNATATDNVAVSSVKFYIGSISQPNLITQDNNDPYTAARSLNASSNGTVKFIAVAVDTSGNTQQAEALVTVNIQQTTPPPSLLTRSRKREDYTLSDTPITLTKAALLSGAFGQPNSDGWYVIKNLRVHSLTPGVACVRLKWMGSDTDLKVKLEDYVFDGLGIPGYAVGGLVAAEAENSLWLHNGLSFSSPPPVGGNGVRCSTARCAVASNPREFMVTNGESYGAGGYYVDGVSGSTAIPYRQLRVTQTSCFNLRGTGYNADGTLNLDAGGRLSIADYIGYNAQFFQLNNAPNTPNVLVDYWTVHNDPNALIGRNAGQAEDMWNVHSSSGVPGSPITFRQYLVENGVPWDPNWTGTQAEYGRDALSDQGLGYRYSGSGGLNDGYTAHGFQGTVTENDIPHHVHAEDGTSLNNVNVGFGVTAGNRATAARIVSYTAGFFPSGHASGSTRIIVRNGGDNLGGNNAVQAFQFYKAQGANALFNRHEFDDLAGSYNWLDDGGVWRQKTLFIDDPNGPAVNGLYPSFKFRVGGVVKAPYNGGVIILPKPTSQADAMAKLSQYRQQRIDGFAAAGKVIGMTDRPLGDVSNYWQRGAGA